MSEDDRPEADREGALPHPRRVYELFGQDAALGEAEHALTSGRMHHAWMIIGPKGVGKASLAWRLARRLLGAAPDSSGALASLPGDPVCRHLEALAHPDFLLIRRPYDDRAGKFKSEIPVEEVRRAPAFFAKSASGKGWRVCIVDSADELNTNSTNALLKTLEEPPERGLLILIVNAPGRLPPTIGSRCRRLILRPPPVEATASWLVSRHKLNATDAKHAAALAHGAPGRALVFAETDAPTLKATIDSALEKLPRFDRSAVMRLAGAAARKDGGQVRAITLDFLIGYAQSRARIEALGEAGAATGASWADAANYIVKLARESETLYLDPRQTVHAAFRLLQDAAADQP